MLQDTFYKSFCSWINFGLLILPFKTLTGQVSYHECIHLWSTFPVLFILHYSNPTSDYCGHAGSFPYPPPGDKASAHRSGSPAREISPWSCDGGTEEAEPRPSHHQPPGGETLQGTTDSVRLDIYRDCSWPVSVLKLCSLLVFHPRRHQCLVDILKFKV